MRFLLLLVSFFTLQATVVKVPTNCSSRPCTYTLSCASATCNSTENTELQTSLDDAQRGDTIILTANQTWSGSFTITQRLGSSGYLTITSTLAANLPPSGVRITPSHTENMPKLLMNSATSVLLFPAGATPAQFIRLVGIEITSTSTVNGGLSTSADLVRIGIGTITLLSQFPSNIEFERCWIHGNYLGEIRNGILANGNGIIVRDSYISEIKMDGIETHAIVSYDGVGPYTYTNNYLEATAIPILIGGGPQSIPEALPSNITITYNFFTKPLKWYSPSPDYVGVPYTNKNMLEYKIGDTSNIQWNVFDQNFKGPNNDQAGQAIAFNIRLPNGPPFASWMVSQNYLFENNIIRKSLGTFSVLGSDTNFSYAGRVKNLVIRNNLFYDIGCIWDFQNCAVAPTTYGRLIAGGEDFTITHNSIKPSDNQAIPPLSFGMLFDGTDSPSILNFNFTNNIAPSGGFTWKGDSLGLGAPTINAKTTGTVVVTKNVMPDMSSYMTTCTGGRICTGNFYPTGTEWDNNIQKWLQPPSNLKLRGNPSASPYFNASSTNEDLGVEMSKLPQIRNLAITVSDRSAVFNWYSTQPISSTPCLMEVSTNRNLVSKLNSWTVIPDVNPVLETGADLSTRTGNVITNLSTTFVVGQDSSVLGQDRNLVANTLYYYRIMCAGDSQEGSFTTNTTQVGSRNFSFSIRPPSGVSQVNITYGEKETGAPGVLISSTSNVPCSTNCIVNINSLSRRTQYFQIRHLDAGGNLIRTLPIIVRP